MQARVYDTIVVGVGGMGSAALCALARRGRRVLGIEQFEVPNELGSSAGSTRIFRFAYFEHPSYVPLMRLAYEGWRALERDTGEALVTVTGGLDIGRRDSTVVAGALSACATHGLAHEVLTGDALARRFPGWRVPGDFAAVLQPEAGIVPADRAAAAHARLAQTLGADLHVNEAVTAWRSDGSRVTVETARGRYEAGSLVLAAGAWTGRLFPALSRRLTPQRQVVGWFETGGSACYRPGAFPVFIIEDETGIYYGFPDLDGGGVKIGRFYHRGETVDPDRVPRDIVPEDEAVLRTALGRYLPGANGAARAFKTCMFVLSPDGHFIVDRLPDAPNVAVAAGFSGHGYKFCPAIGEMLADLVTTGGAPADSALFRLSRVTDGAPG